MDLERNVDSANRVYGDSGEGIGSLYQPDALVNDQYLQSFRAGASFEPEKELMLAVLEDAIKTLQDNRTALCSQRKRLVEETEEWFFSDNADWVFSFVSVCATLGLDPDYLRNGISRWRHLGLSGSLN